MDKAAAGNRFAKAAVDVAVHDGPGRLLGVPVSALYGGQVRASMPVLWALVSGNADTAADEAARMLEAPRHNHFKIKMGYGHAETQTRRAGSGSDARRVGKKGGRRGHSGRSAA